MTTPNDLANRRLQKAAEPARAHHTALDAAIAEVDHCMDHFTKHYRVDQAIHLTEVTLANVLEEW